MTIIRRAAETEPTVRPIIEPDNLRDDRDELAGNAPQDHAETIATIPADAALAVRASESADGITDLHHAEQPADDLEPLPPLFHVMAATPKSGATTLAAWAGCAAEVERDLQWRPPPDSSPHLVITAPKSPDGVRAARQLAGALSRTVGGGVHVAAIALLEDQPRPTLALRELIEAAERAGIPIHTLAHDPRMRFPTDLEHERAWTPQNAEHPAVPPVLEHIYRHVFHHIAAKETSK
ncbi:hypothetical protein [Nocardia vermiculata]|uniref:Uncharacterized protein n=1 Tax=Nocardia vermiculata TaxID=257274 RepID=A0A846Y883_9NOCA|nr:hypothetical protein [Nocardia vermiculata]NKY53951.1 hypothetical protein [Nocardia vermiculata]